MIKVGDKLPAGIFKTMGAEGPEERSVEQIFSGRKVILFGLPGAFTPTCHHNHLPGYVDSHDGLKELGVDEIAVVSVNDVFVMDAWDNISGSGGKVTFLADGNATYAKALGLDIDLSVADMGVRCQRFSMIVDDGVVSHFNLEEQKGVAEKTGAAVIIQQLKGEE